LHSEILGFNSRLIDFISGLRLHGGQVLELEE